MVMAGTRYGNLVTIKLLDCHEIFLLLLPEFEQINFSSINPFMTEVVIIQKPDWFLYDNALRHERVNIRSEIWQDP